MPSRGQTATQQVAHAYKIISRLAIRPLQLLEPGPCKMNTRSRVKRKRCGASRNELKLTTDNSDDSPDTAQIVNYYPNFSNRENPMSLKIENREAVQATSHPDPDWAVWRDSNIQTATRFLSSDFLFAPNGLRFRTCRSRPLGRLPAGKAAVGRPVARARTREYKEKKGLGRAAWCAWTEFASANRIHWTWLASLPFRQLPTIPIVLEPPWV